MSMKHIPGIDSVETDIASTNEKSGSILVEEGPTKGQLIGVLASSSVDKLKKP